MNLQVTMVVVTKVSKASSKSPSVRTTIPESVVEEIGIEVGDALAWEVASERERKIVKIRKVE